jgi:Ca2+:H+ antiporter
MAAADDSNAASETFDPPTARQATVSLLYLLVALVGVILLAKMLAPSLTSLIVSAGLPFAFTGVVIAALVLAPESIAAVRASLSNRPQTSINLALGSALASIALTIPVITLIAAFTEVELALGVPPAKMVLLVLAMFVSVITLLPGRTTVLHGVVHLAIFAMFLVVAAEP